jgi:4-diphosphocytidyl-2-C-methyl-D-erythritol kinase
MRQAVAAHAKVNLALYVLGKRPDGYHDIATVLQLVSLHDTITFDFAATGYSFTCSDPSLADSESNLVTRAVRALEQATGRPIAVSIHLEKAIPVGAGLGGGSSDCAATLRAVHDRLGLGLSTATLYRLAGDLGSDVPFFLTSGQALAEGRGERLTELAWPTNYHVCIAFPGIPVSAREGYSRARITLTNPLIDGTIRRYLTPGSFGGWVQSCANDLEQGVAAYVPEVTQGVEAMRALGAIHAAMTGSGSALFGVFERPVPADIAERWPVAGSWRVMAARPVRISGLPVPSTGEA